jgi:hypothetical protein
LLASLAQASHGSHSCSDQITHRLVGAIRNPDRRQFTRAVEAGQFSRVSPIGLDPISRTTGDHGWGNHNAAMASNCHLTLNAVPAWPGLIADMKLDIRPGKLREQFGQGRWRVRDLAVLTNFRAFAILSNGYRYRILMDVQAHILDQLAHRPPPCMDHTGKPGTISTLQITRRDRPASGGHVV